MTTTLLVNEKNTYDVIGKNPHRHDATDKVTGLTSTSDLWHPAVFGYTTAAGHSARAASRKRRTTETGSFS